MKLPFIYINEDKDIYAKLAEDIKNYLLLIIPDTNYIGIEFLSSKRTTTLYVEIPVSFNEKVSIVNLLNLLSDKNIINTEVVETESGILETIENSNVSPVEVIGYKTILGSDFTFNVLKDNDGDDYNLISPTYAGYGIQCKCISFNIQFKNK